jgi:hypothetical protein
MSYKSIDNLQKALGEDVFNYTSDKKKAAGRALGTLIEIITYYLLNEWKFTNNVSIERGLEEYGNPEITHNVEFTMHPILSVTKLCVNMPCTPNTLKKELNLTNEFVLKNNPLLDKNNILKNACTIAESENEIILALFVSKTDNKITLNIVRQSKKPFAMFECKRVGVEEGNKKGPQTIEKAKQGAYVAKTTSSLQKIRNENGDLYGLIYKNGKPYIEQYSKLLKNIIVSKEPLPEDFTMSIGIVSNHGNWFTSENQNKELKVLAQSYDWLLFLTDEGLSEFVTDLLIKPKKKYKCIQEAFHCAYKEDKKKNAFTKVKMNLDAHNALVEYFKEKINHIENNWFNIISPNHGSINNLKKDLTKLTLKTNIKRK